MKTRRLDAQTSGTKKMTNAQDFTNPALFSPKGRIGRQRFLAILVISWLASVVVAAVFQYVLLVYRYDPNSDLASGIASLLVFLYSAAALLAVVFASIKRCRDAGASPLWTLLLLVPTLNLCLLIFLAVKASEPFSSGGSSAAQK